MCDDWDKIKEELSEIGPFDVNRALEPAFLRKCFSTLLTTTDNKRRRKLESGLKRLSSKPDIIFVLSNLIIEDNDLNIRLYACSFLANSTSRLVDAIVEAESSSSKFEALANILFLGLSHLELPSNLRTFLLNGLGTFMAKTFPDVWPDAVERVANKDGDYNPAYVFESLAIFARVSRSLPINFHAKQQREASMWSKFTSVIEPYTMAILSQLTNVQTWEALSLMLAEWTKMRDPLMNVIRPVIVKMIENNCYNPRSLSTLINGFNELDYEMTESRMFMCVILSSQVHTPLLDAIARTIQDSSAGFESDEATSITELVHIMFEFYANIMNRSSRCFLFRATENMEERVQYELVLGRMFDFSSQVMALCYRRNYDVSNAIGTFYSTIRQTLVDDFYNIENFLAEIMLSKGQQAVSYVFEASIITEAVSFDSSEYEEVMQFRELFLDLFLLLDALALKLNNELASNKYVEFLQECVKRRDFSRLSAMLYYFKELPLDFNYANVLVNLNLNWESMDIISQTDEQTVDFFQNYFGYVSNLFKDAGCRQKYEGLIRETLRIAMSFLMALPTSSNGCRNLVRNAENADLYVIECFKLINEFSSQVSFDQSFCQELCCICMAYYESSRKREVIKLATKSLADCVSFDGLDSKKIGLSFFELICSKLHQLCLALKGAPKNAEIQAKIKSYVEDLGIFCSSLSGNAVSTISPELSEIMWEAILFLIREEIDAEIIYQLVDPFLTVITPEIYKKFALEMPSFVHKYPELISRILRASLQHKTDFLLTSVVPVIFDFVWSIFSVTMSTKDVQAGDQATLELVFIFFRRHIELFLKYVSKLSSFFSVKNFIHASIGISLKSITQSFTDESIVRGLRVIEGIVDIRNDDVLACLNETNTHIIPAVLDLIFSVYFSCTQMSIAKILFFFAHYSPDDLRTHLMNHRAGTMRGVDLMLAKNATRPLILKHIILWNDVWNREHPDD